MLEERYTSLRTQLLVFVPLLLLAYSCSCESSKTGTTINSFDDHSKSNHYEQTNGKIDFIQTIHSRQKRSFAIYTCKRNSCDAKGCKPESYHGPHPPKWCLRNPHKKQTICSWTNTCINKRCETYSTSCRHEFQEHSNGRLQPKSTFNFECFAKQNICNVEQCKGLTNCGKKTTITMTQFENNFLKKLPRCDEVDGKKSGRKGREAFDTFEDNNEKIVSRWKRAPISVSNLQGYCCEVGERWGGVIVAHVRPKLG